MPRASTSSISWSSSTGRWTSSRPRDAEILNDYKSGQVLFRRIRSLGEGIPTPYRYDIYIGSENGSRRIRKDYLDRIKAWADETFPNGYTLLKGEGVYRGNPEESVLLYALSDHDLSIRERLERLKHELGQEAILLTKSEVDFELI